MNTATASVIARMRTASARPRRAARARPAPSPRARRTPDHDPARYDACRSGGYHAASALSGAIRQAHAGADYRARDRQSCERLRHREHGGAERPIASARAPPGADRPERSSRMPTAMHRRERGKYALVRSPSEGRIERGARAVSSGEITALTVRYRYDRRYPPRTRIDAKGSASRSVPAGFRPPTSRTGR